MQFVNVFFVYWPDAVYVNPVAAHVYEPQAVACVDVTVGGGHNANVAKVRGVGRFSPMSPSIKFVEGTFEVPMMEEAIVVEGAT
jgi:hypothetical protein